MSFTVERFISAESRQIEIEHVHRYVLARHFCRGKNVLDAASGESYGVPLLSQVIDADVADEPWKHASRNYARDPPIIRRGRREAAPGRGCIGDVVVSFEIITPVRSRTLPARNSAGLHLAGLLILNGPERDIYSP